MARPHASQQDAATRKYWKIELEISLPTRVEEDPTFEEKVIQFLKEKKGDLTQTVVVCMADATGQLIRKWEVTIDYRDVDLSQSILFKKCIEKKVKAEMVGYF